MKIIKHDPAGQNLLSFPEAVDRMFNDGLFDPFGWFMAPVGASKHPAMMPSVNISENDKEVRIDASVPGYTREQVEVEVDQNTLFIHGKASEEKEEEGKRWHRREHHMSEIHREIALPNYVDTGKITSVMKNGILHIILPKKKENGKKKINIKAE